MPNYLVERGTTTQVVQPFGMNWMPSRVEKRGHGDREWISEKNKMLCNVLIDKGERE